MARKRRTLLWLGAGLGLIAAAYALRAPKKVAAAEGSFKQRRRTPVKKVEPKEDPTAPQDHTKIFANHRQFVDGCFERDVGLDQPNFDLAVRTLKMCALDEMFPDHAWPPGPDAHQWQRNVWSDVDFTVYAQGKFKTADVPGP